MKGTNVLEMGAGHGKKKMGNKFIMGEEASGRDYLRAVCITGCGGTAKGRNA
jgi:hypothetical protein